MPRQDWPTGEDERVARRRYDAALTAARELFLRAEAHFAASAAAIDFHIQQARAAADRRVRLAIDATATRAPSPAKP